jgi:hypothetical protein
VPAGDGLRGVALRVQGAGRDDRPGQVSERLQQFPDGRDLIGLRVHGGLAEDRADTVRQGRDQVRAFLFPVPGAADGLAVDRDYQPAAGLRRPGVKPGANDLAGHARADQGERAPERGLLRRPADRSEPGQHAGPGIGGPLADRGERP